MKEQICPLAIIDADGSECGYLRCPNRRYCDQQTRAWPVPWVFSLDGCLRVRVGELVREAEATFEEDPEGPEFMMIAAAESLSFLNIWAEEVGKFGWAAGQLLPCRNDDEED